MSSPHSTVKQDGPSTKIRPRKNIRGQPECNSTFQGPYTPTNVKTHRHEIPLYQGRPAQRQYKHYLRGGDRGVVVIVVGNGHGDTSSNPGRG